MKTTIRKGLREIHEFKCKKCGKLLKANSENHADALIKIHNQFCKGRGK